jgi:hypothetical protein
MGGIPSLGRFPRTEAFVVAGRKRHYVRFGARPASALTRIQNAVILADEDLRQLSELNAQARQMEKKLVKK